MPHVCGPYYSGVLGVAPTASRVQVKYAFRTLAKSCHPDLQSDSDSLFKGISRAYATLANPTRRAACDARCTQVRAGARRRLAGVIATMAVSFMLTVSSGVAIVGWLLGAS
jgi:DnaJ-class molecular chaperone